MEARTPSPQRLLWSSTSTPTQLFKVSKSLVMSILICVCCVLWVVCCMPCIVCCVLFRSNWLRLLALRSLYVLWWTASSLCNVRVFFFLWFDHMHRHSERYSETLLYFSSSLLFFLPSGLPSPSPLSPFATSPPCSLSLFPFFLSHSIPPSLSHDMTGTAKPTKYTLIHDEIKMTVSVT